MGYSKDKYSPYITFLRRYSTMKSMEIRQKFFDFFVRNGHTQVASSSLIPAEDPTLLFANAGMNQFKDCFLGKEKRSYTRAVSIQKCIRAGGKHNDLDNVGRTKRHLTFFEMMGNFSFGGDYFKKDAIRFAWDFLTQEMLLNQEKLYVSIYQNDDEAYEIWHKEIGIPAERIIRLGAKDNFWQMGDTGPCGPCTEIHYDFGPRTSEEENLKVGEEGERFLEIWNLVFMQFDRQPDGTDIPLAKPGVDTGMGLERLCWVVQGVNSSYETDLFAGIFKGIEALCGKKYYESDTETQTAFRVLADHIRSTSLAIADGGTPSNEGRGYVLRKIIRRAALFAQKLGDAMIFPRLAPTMIAEMGKLYPELITNKALIITLLTSEVEKFAYNLEQGQTVLARYLKESAQTKIITGSQAFKLHDTYGFPLELTNLVAFEKGYNVDIAGFEAEMERQRLQSGKKDASAVSSLKLDDALVTTFTGYDELETTSEIIALVKNDQLVDKVNTGDECWVITEKSPFYIECGGQIDDRGSITTAEKETALLLDLSKINNAIAAKIRAPHALKVGETVTLTVDKEFRDALLKNHTATHLLQAALVKTLGSQVKQAGSLVTPDYLRFDFTHHQAISNQEIKEIERLVNQAIMANIPVNISQSTYKNAIERGVTAFFGEKYNPENVRVVEIPKVSAELCGGTHVKATGDIGCFKITNNSSLSAGVRRITAVTGLKALELFQHDFEMIKVIAQEGKVQHEEALQVFVKQQETLKSAEQTIRHLKQEVLLSQVPTLLDTVEMIGTLPFAFIRLDGKTTAELRDVGTLLVEKKPALYFLLSKEATTNSFFVICPTQFESVCNRLKSLGLYLQKYGFKGGGKQGILQGSCTTIPANLKELIIAWLQQH